MSLSNNICFNEYLATIICLKPVTSVTNVFWECRFLMFVTYLITVILYYNICLYKVKCCIAIKD